jgi:hypothetical protein
MATFHLVQTDGSAVAVVFPDDAVIAPGGGSASWSGGSFTAPPGETLTLVAPSPPAPTATQLRAYANAKVDGLRAVARSYTLTGGLAVLCDATQGTGIDLYGLLNWGTANPAATTNFVQDNGGVVTLTGAQSVALANAVLAYGQSLFAVLAVAMNGIDNATIATTAAIDALSWPT